MNSFQHEIDLQVSLLALNVLQTNNANPKSLEF